MIAIKKQRKGVMSMKRNGYLTAGFGGVCPSSVYAATGSENDALKFHKTKIMFSQTVVAA